MEYISANVDEKDVVELRKWAIGAISKTNPMVANEFLVDVFTSLKYAEQRITEKKEAEKNDAGRLAN
jgi:hypothetical protein